MLHTDKPHLQIDYDPALCCVVHTWRGHCTEDDYRQAMYRCLELLYQTEARGLIVDLRAAAHDHWLEDHWTAETWFPELLATDVQKLAVVAASPPNTAPHVFPASGDALLTGRYFPTLGEARHWVAQRGV